MASTCEVNVKWGKEKYTVTIDLTQPPSAFKAQLYSLTHVPVDKQKSKIIIMIISSSIFSFLFISDFIRLFIYFIVIY